MESRKYSSIEETKRILGIVLSSADLLSLPSGVIAISSNVLFTTERDYPYFPIPFKETETAAALKALEGSLASILSVVRYGWSSPPLVTINLEKVTAFLFQAYLATVGGYGKLDARVKSFLKGNVLTNITMMAVLTSKQIQIYIKRSQIHIAACRPICTRLNDLVNIIIYMAHSMLRPHSK
jgi:hypothetical protein